MNTRGIPRGTEQEQQQMSDGIGRKKRRINNAVSQTAQLTKEEL